MPSQELAVEPSKKSKPSVELDYFDGNGYLEDALLIGFLAGRLRHHDVFPPRIPRDKAPSHDEIKDRLMTVYDLSAEELNTFIWLSGGSQTERSQVFEGLKMRAPKNLKNGNGRSTRK
jgi:hypothetical protein